MRTKKSTLAVLARPGKGILVILMLLILAGISYSQDDTRRATRQSATEAYSRNDFVSALSQFTELSQQFPRDPLYKYYSGVCLVKLEREPARASALLLEAIKGSAAIRTVPSDGYFYLGRAQQMSGLFGEAIESFNNFSMLVGRREAREMNVDDFIGQCKDGKGRISSGEPGDDARTGKEVNTPLFTKPVERAEPGEEQKPAEVRANVDTVPGEYDKMMTRALELQYKSDSADLEETAKEYRNLAARQIREVRRETELPEEIQTDTASEKTNVTQPIQEVNRPDNEAFPAVEVINDTVIIPSQRSVEIFSVFEIRKNPEAWPEEKIEVDPELPAGLIYRIQVAVFRNPVLSSYFKGMNPVYGFKNPSNGLTTYYAGLFRKSDDAGKALSRIRSLGFKDALMGAVMDGKVISADRAGLLEKDWGNKPLQVLKPDLLETVADTVPPGLKLRDQISLWQ